MITNILLGLILAIVITSFIILNNKIINLYKLLSKITDIELTTNNNITETLKLFSNLVDRFNNFVLRYNESKNLLETKVNNNTEYFAKTLIDITNKINEVNEYIKVEHIITRNDIKKLAKISSKNKKALNQSKSINKK